MMKHLFVHYELALLAKEKGFDEPCFALYDRSKDKEFRYCPDNFLFCYNEKTPNTVKVHDWIFTAPLYQQLVDWFREKHLIAIEPLTWVEKTTWMVRNRQTNETLKTFVESDYYLGFNSVLTEAFKLI